MSKKLDTDTKVVQMRFDNSKFQRNINKTIKSVNELDKSLEFKEGKDGLKDVSKALDEIDLKKRNKELEKSESIVHKITVSLGSLIKIKVLSRALDTVINKTSAFVKNLAGINNVVAGWQQYEDQITNVGGILNQVAKDGYGLNDVADAMERLQWYTDETSFSFTTLSNGIRQFTVAGIDLNKATEAAMGVTNLAGSAKVFDEFKVQSGMDAVSKAMQQGYMDTMKWTSLTNTAGIVTKDFTEILLQEAKAQGKLVESEAGQYKTRKKGTLVTQDNIRNTLSEKWLTSDILANALKRYSSASSAVQDFMNAVEDGSEESLAAVNEMLKDTGKQFTSFDDLLKEFPDDVNANNLTARRAVDILEQMGYQFDEIGLAAFKSSQETTSFSQAIKATKDAIKTGWASIFQSIFGDYEQATALWSDVSDMLYDIFVEPMNNLKDTFKEWSELESGGLQDVHETIKSIIEIVGLFKNAVGEAFSAVFGEANADIIATIVLKLKQFTQSIKNNERIFKTVTAVAKIFFTIIKVIGKLLGAAFKIAGKLLTALSPLFDLIVDGFVRAVDGLVAFIDWLEELGVLDAIVNGLTTAIGWLVNSIKTLFEWLGGKVDLKKVSENFGKAIEWLGDCFSKLGEWIYSCWQNLKDWWEESEIAQAVTENFTNAINWLKDAFEKLKKPFSDIIGYFKEFSFLEALVHAFERMKEVGQNVWAWLNGIWGKIIKFLEDTGALEKILKFWEKVKEVFNWIKDVLVGFFNKMKEHFADKSFEEILKTILKAMGILALIVLAIQFIGIIVRWKWVLDSISDMFYGFATRMKAEAIRSLGFTLIEIAASLWVFAMAVHELDKINWKESWKSVVAMSIFFAVFTSVLVVFIMLSSLFKGSVRASLQMLAFTSSLAILMLVIKKVIKISADIDHKELWHIIKVISTLSLVMGITFALTKVPGKVPMLISFAKLILGFWAFLKIVMWLFKEASTNTGITVGGIAIGMVILEAAIFALWRIMLALKYYNLQSVFVKGMGRMTFATTRKLSISLSGLASVIIAGFLIMKIAKDMSVGDIFKGSLAIFMIIVNIAAIAAAMTLLGKIKMNPKAGMQLYQVNKSLLSIALTVIVMVMIAKMLSGVSSYEMGSAVAVILTMFVAIGIIAIGLSVTQKIITKTKSFDKNSGFSMTGGKRTSIIGTLLGITLTILAFMLIAELIKNMDVPKIFKTAWKMVAIFGALAVVAAGINIASKFSDKGSIIATTVFISVLIGLVAAVLGLFIWVSKIDPMLIIDGAFVIGSIIAGFAGILIGLSWIKKNHAFDTKDVVLTLVLIAGIEVLIAGLFGLMAWADHMTKDGFNVSAIGLILVAISLLALIMIGVNFLDKTSMDKTKLGKTFVKLGMVVIVLGMIAALIAMVYYIMQIAGGDTKRLWAATGVLGVLAAILIVIMIVTSIMAEVDFDTGRLIAMVAVIATFSLCIIALALALDIISQVDQKSLKSSLIVMGVFTGILILIIAALMLMAAKAKPDTIAKINATLLAVSVTFLAIGATLLMLAMALKMISDIPAEDCLRAAIVLGILMIIIGGIIIALTALAVGTGGVGAAVILAIAVALVAVGAAAVLLATSIVILAEGVDRLIDALNKVTPKIIGQAIELGMALVALAAANIASGFMNLTGSILNLGAATIDSFTGAIKVINEFGKTVQKGIAALGKWFEGIGDASKIKSMGKALDKFDLDKINAFNNFVNSLHSLADIGAIIDTVNSRLDDFTKMMDQLSTAANRAGISVSLLQFMKMLNAIAMIPKETVESLTLMMDALNSILDKDLNIEPKITPIFDLTAFDEGISHMRGQLDSVGLTNTTDIAYTAKSSADQSKGGLIAGFTDTLKSMANGLGIGGGHNPIQIIQNFNDTLMYGYNARRGIANTVLDSVTGLFKR